MILRGEFKRNFLANLKVLTILFSDAFGYEILEEVPNIEKLAVCGGSLKKMFCCQSPNNVDYSGLLLQLKILHLESLEKLVSIGLENSLTQPFVRNLENLVTCRVSFSNLIYLKVENCDSLSYLFTSSTAKSLAKLQRMAIEECESIEEIASKEGEESDDEDEIIFPKLNCLNLKYLNNLLWLYKGSLSFPLLEDLSITQCDEMATLCPGTLKTIKLAEVIPLEIDLSSTLFKEFMSKVPIFGVNLK
ncbi:hypothetical protein LR48_Vigan11g101800 [Vigna angularis]|uniref:Disease resistance protein At4g27190-like leucine-rich repeats domain-containing protein n=1 Tax=Phaseolus angularis TaxID=3914 RepID=A0A0L9VSF7_PHAAN|nr:hypothetical protein LR48_Vigan11g101800 [Vigna angularis]